MYDGYMTLSGTEVINAERTALYVQRAHPEVNFNDALHGIERELHLYLGDKPYESPLVDHADWADPDDPDTYGFYGLYPIEVNGLSDSTLTTAIEESIHDGGFATGMRHTTRDIRVRGVLLGSSEESVEAGHRWLAAALDTMPYKVCATHQMCVLSAIPPLTQDSPDFISIEDCIAPYRRHLKEINTVQGPRMIQQRTAGRGLVLREVEFTLNAANPFFYSDPVLAANSVSGTSAVISQIECPALAEAPIVDPDCPVVPFAPTAPQIDTMCGVDVASWRRFYAHIPGSVVPTWTEMVPIIRLSAKALPLRQVRFRFYPNPFGYKAPGFGPGAVEECDHWGEFLVTYVPARSTMVIDGTMAEGRLEIPGKHHPRPAGHLLFGSDGKPMTWPMLSCGIPYIVTVDVYPTTTQMSSMSLEIDLVGRSS